MRLRPSCRPHCTKRAEATSISRDVSILDIVMITGLPVAGKGTGNPEGEAHGDRGDI